MQQLKWSKHNEKDLARFVTGDSVQLLNKLGVNRFDLSHDPGGRRQLVRAIYDALLARNINYAYEQYQPEAITQIIRSPHEILDTQGEGTCLDLAALFCGLCLGYELLPLLIVTEGHAFAAVSLNHSLNQWDKAFDRERNLFNQAKLFEGSANLEELKKLIDNESYIAIECTGFAHTQSFGNSSLPEAKRRKADGTLSFDNAVSAGREQLDNESRSFKFAIDVAVAHYAWKIEPLPIQGFDSQQERSVLPATHVEASGDRSIATVNADGATLVTGDGNVVGNGNIVQTVKQRGRYNINLGSAGNVKIGDTVYQQWNGQAAKGREQLDNLDEAANELLMAAFASIKKTIDVQVIGNFGGSVVKIMADNRTFGGTSETVGQYQYAIAQLVDKGLIKLKTESNNKTIYELSLLGYEYCSQKREGQH
jgi:Effector-associated domain 10